MNIAPGKGNLISIIAVPPGDAPTDLIDRPAIGVLKVRTGRGGIYIAFIELDYNVSCRVLCHLPIVRRVKLDYFTIKYFVLQLSG